MFRTFFHWVSGGLIAKSRASHVGLSIVKYIFNKIIPSQKRRKHVILLLKIIYEMLVPGA